MADVLDIHADTVAFLQRRIKDMYADGRSGSPSLGSPGSAQDNAPITAKAMAENIAFGAAVAGSGHIEMVEQPPWWFVASATNWMACGDAHAEPRELFERIVPFPEQGPTSHRTEIYVTAFAAEAYYAINDRVTWIRAASGGRARGKASTTVALPHVGVVPSWCTTVLAFRI